MAGEEALELRRLERKRRRVVRAGLQVVVPSFGLYTWYCLWLLLGPSTEREGFYAACAQIIPVLLLVLGLEIRFFRFPEAHRSRTISALLGAVRFYRHSRSLAAVTRIAILIMLCAAEVLCLGALANPANVTPLTGRLVFAAVATALLAIALVAVRPVMFEDLHADDRNDDDK